MTNVITDDAEHARQTRALRRSTSLLKDGARRDRKIAWRTTRDPREASAPRNIVSRDPSMKERLLRNIAFGMFLKDEAERLAGPLAELRRQAPQPGDVYADMDFEGYPSAWVLSERQLDGSFIAHQVITCRSYAETLGEIRIPSGPLHTEFLLQLNSDPMWLNRLSPRIGRLDETVLDRIQRFGELHLKRMRRSV